VSVLNLKRLKSDIKGVQASTLSRLYQAPICCPHCNSSELVKSGTIKRKDGSKTQLYRCKVCKHHFRDRRGYGHKKKNPQEVMDFAVELSRSQNPAYSTRDIARVIQKKFSIKVSHAAVSKWISATVSPIDLILDVPCFRCLINKKVSPFLCFPAKCNELEDWLLYKSNPSLR